MRTTTEASTGAVLAAAGADEKAEAVTAGAEALALALGSAAEVAGAACDAAGADDATGAALALAADGDAEADESEEPEPGEEEPEFWELLLEEVSQETVQDFFSSTRGSPLGPVTGVCVIVQVSVTGPAFLSGVPRGRRECQQGGWEGRERERGAAGTHVWLVWLWVSVTGWERSWRRRTTVVSVRGAGAGAGAAEAAVRSRRRPRDGKSMVACGCGCVCRTRRRG